MLRRGLFLAVILLTACSPAAAPAAPASPPPGPPEALPAPSTIPDTSPPPRAPTVPVVSPSPVPTNVRVHDPNEYQFPRLLPFDGIPPVYDPEFARAPDAPLLDDELVIGIALGGEAKAYPITVLRFREIVDDELDGVPILVTW